MGGLILIWFFPFATLVVTAIMAVLVWIERSNQRTPKVIPPPSFAGVTWTQRSVDRQRELAVDAGSASRRIKLRDVFSCWGIVTWLIVLLMPHSYLSSPFGIDLLLVFHPVFCVGWWLSLHRRGVAHSEVYALAAWTFGYVATATAMIAPLEWVQWTDPIDRLEGEWLGEALGRWLGIPAALAAGIWLGYVVSGVVCAAGGVELAQLSEPRISPLKFAVAWFPMSCVVLATSTIFGIMALLMSVGLAGFGISVVMRRKQDDAEPGGELDKGEEARKIRLNMPQQIVQRTAIIVTIATVLSVAVRESGLFNLVFVVALTWFVTILASVAAAWLARRDAGDHNLVAWAAWSFVAVVAANAFQGLLVETVNWLSSLIAVIEGASAHALTVLWMSSYVQAWVVGLVAASLLLFALFRGHILSYGAMLLGLIWVPVAIYVGGLHSDAEPLLELTDRSAIAGACVIGCVILFVMWRYLGPGALRGVAAADVTATQVEVGRAESQPPSEHVPSPEVR